jgi:cell division protease FtsH
VATRHIAPPVLPTYGLYRMAAPVQSPPEPVKPFRALRTLWLFPVLLLAVTLWTAFTAKPSPDHRIDYTAFYSDVDQGKVASAVLSGKDVSGKFKQDETIDGQKVRVFVTSLPEQEDRDLLPLLRAKNVDVAVTTEHPGFLGPILATLLPWVLILGGWIWMSRRMQRVGGGVASAFGLSARSHRFERQDSVRVRFDDVAGLAGAKRDLCEVVDFLREPERFRRLGGKLPRGVLLVGPPGTGKTLLARAVAGEAEAPFFYVNGSEFIQMFVGVGAQRVRELFDEAKKAGPSIVFIDEIDAVGRSRGTGLGGVNDEREQTLNQLLSELDGFSRNDLTVVIGATNRPDVLDAALLRPGRFDRRVVVDRPECKAREAILRVHTKDKPLAPDVSIEDLAVATPGFSGADLANLCNEAALIATRRSADAVASVDFAAAMDKIILGDPRETLLDVEEKRRVAIHESGHATAAHFTPEAQPLRRVSILPRGLALGATQQTEARDQHIVTQPQLDARLRVLMGGYAAERVVLGNVSSGAEEDLRTATDVAFKMVAHYGMSKRIGPVFHEQRLEHPFLGQRLATESGVSDVTSHIIEDEVRRVLCDALAAAEQTIKRHRAALDRLVAALLEHETLEKTQLDEVLPDEDDEVEASSSPGMPRRSDTHAAR